MGCDKHIMSSINVVCCPLQASLGGRVRLMITGAAPISPSVLTFMKAAIGCQVTHGWAQFLLYMPLPVLFFHRLVIRLMLFWSVLWRLWTNRVYCWMQHDRAWRWDCRWESLKKSDLPVQPQYFSLRLFECSLVQFLDRLINLRQQVTSDLLCLATQLNWWMWLRWTTWLWTGRGRWRETQITKP